MARVFGEIGGVREGTSFATRAAAAEAGVHRPLQAGISGSANEGADSIVVSGGYEDDRDDGDVIVYTGHGGNDPASKTQIDHQTLTRQNLALAVSADQGLPVRVLRGAGGDPTHAPSSGYRYDGLFYIDSYWKATGRSGYDIWRFKLVKDEPVDRTADEGSAPAPGPGGRRQGYSTVQRTVRNTAVTQWVKELHDFTCQICGERLKTAAGPYAEGAHVRPLGKPHDGPDAVDNVLCLCPNDHVRLDRGAIGFDGSGNVIDLDTGRATRKLRVKPGHNLDAAHAHYHWSLFAD